MALQATCLACAGRETRSSVPSRPDYDIHLGTNVRNQQKRESCW